MVGRLGSESFPDFLRMHWNSRQSFARQSELFKVIRGRVNEREAVFSLLREMDEDIDTYLALTQPEGADYWTAQWRESAQELRMFSVRQPDPMLMAARRRLNAADFSGLLRATVVIAFRYNIIGAQHTGEQERVYHNVAMQIHRGEAHDLSSVLKALRSVYRSDDEFRADFADRSIKPSQSRNAKIIRYILSKLEQQAGRADLDRDSSLYTPEHVLPQSPATGWEAFSDRDLDNFVHRLANLVLLEAGKDRELANKPYDDKRPVLMTSQVLLTRQLADQNDEWTPERLEARQRHMAKLATSNWRIDQLS
jgi:hypothetical protein